MKKMKRFKKMLSFILTVAMSLAMMVPVMAASNPAPTTGSITVKSGTGENGLTVNGKTFKAYRVLDATMVENAITNSDGTTSNGFAYTVPSGLKDFYKLRFNIANNLSDADFNKAVTDGISAIGSDDSAALEDFSKAVLAAAKAANITPSEAIGANEEVKFTGLPLGYYVVEDEGAATPLSALILDTTSPDAVVNIKATKPVLEKEINKNTSEEGEADWNVSNNQAIGKAVEYRLTSYVPDMRGYKSYQFVMNDILSKGLSFNETTSNMTINIEGKTEALTKGALDADGNVTGGDYAIKVTENYVGSAATNDAGLSGTKVEIVFADFYTNYNSEAFRGKKITVTYQATVNEEAIIGVSGNRNDASLKYSNKPGESHQGQPDYPGPTDPTGETPWDVVRTYVTGIELFKVDGNNNKAPLAGATFKISGNQLGTVLVDKVSFNAVGADFTGTKYWKLNDGSYTLTDPATEGIDTTKYVKNSDDTYTVYERITTREAVSTTENVSITATTDENGVLTFDGLKAGDYWIIEEKAPAGYNKVNDIQVKIEWVEPAAGKTDCTWKYNGTAGGNRYEIAIENKTGTELPSTGGIGTTIFYIIGGILVVGAAILLVTKKRMSKEA